MSTPTQQLKNNISKAVISPVNGMSLIELMIAIVISLILMAGISTIFINSKQAYRIQQDTSVMQENSRVLLNLLSYDLRLADHWGGVDSDNVDDPYSAAPGDCDSAWIVDPANGIVGYEGASSSPLPSACLADADYVANTDIVVVRFADGDGMVTNAELDDSNNMSKFFVKAEAGRRAGIDSGYSLYTSDTAVIGEYNYPYKIAVYFIRPCSVKLSVDCSSSDDNGSPIPTLTRLVFDGSTLIQEPLIEGVEQLQLEYGLMDSTGSVDQFKEAGAMAASDWQNVASVKIGIIARADSRDIAYTDSKTYRFPDPDSTATADDDDFTPSGTNQKYHRKQFIKTVNVRNRVRS